MNSQELKNKRKELKLATAAEFRRLLNIQHRFDFVDEQEWDKADASGDYDELDMLADSCTTIQVTGSQDDYYVKLLAIDSKGGLYIADEVDLGRQNWVPFSQVHGSYYEIETIELMESKLK